jgi:hypothetical protein
MAGVCVMVVDGAGVISAVDEIAYLLQQVAELGMAVLPPRLKVAIL